MRSFRGLWAVLAAGGGLALSGGCADSSYEELTTRRATEATNTAEFKDLGPAVQLADAPVRLRVPKLFGLESHMPGGKQPEDRLQPPFLQIPGFRLSCEHWWNMGNAKYPIYLYMGALPGQAGQAAKVAGELKAQINEAFKDTPDWQEVNWEEVSAKTPQGTNLAWQKIRAVGDQQFLVKITGKDEVQKIAGTFELWMHDDPRWLVLVGWRVPAQAEGANIAAPPTLVGLPVPNQVQLPQKLDTNLMPRLTAGTMTFVSGPGGAPIAAGGEGQ